MRLPRLQGRGGFFDPHAGDEPPPRFPPQQWGRRILLSVNDFGNSQSNPHPTDRNTFIETSDLGRSYPINVQFRFAQAASDGTPILPFSPAWPITLVSGVALQIHVRRGTDEVAPVATDTYNLVADLSGTGGSVLPFDIVTARNLGIDATLVNDGGLATGVWVEAIATIVTSISDQNKITGWQVATQQGVLPSVASPASRVLLPAHADRQQFMVTNTSTNANLILSFADAASWGPPVVVGSIILPKNVFARYESPVGGYRGIVSGSWDNAAPDGGALVTEGTFF